MNTNQIFNWKRFTAALRKEFVENWRQLALILLVMFLLFTVFMVLGNIISNKVGGGDEDKIIIAIMPAVFIHSVYAIVIMVFASLAFRNLTTKTGRIALLTAPISTTEKYVVNLTIYVIGALVALFACIQLADLTRFAILSPFKSDSFAVPGPINFFTTLLNSTDDIMSITSSISQVGKGSNMMLLTAIGLFMSPAMFFMGSVLWPRWALIKTFAAQQIINTVINGILIVAFSIPVVFGASKLSEEFSAKMIDIQTISTYIGFAISLVCWYGSWYLFKHKDVVSLKWWK